MDTTILVQFADVELTIMGRCKIKRDINILRADNASIIFEWTEYIFYPEKQLPYQGNCRIQTETGIFFGIYDPYKNLFSWKIRVIISK